MQSVPFIDVTRVLTSAVYREKGLLWFTVHGSLMEGKEGEQECAVAGCEDRDVATHF